MTDSVSLSTKREAVEEFLKLARSRRAGLKSLAKNTTPGMKRHAGKRLAEAAWWGEVVEDCEAALALADDERMDFEESDAAAAHPGNPANYGDGEP